MNFMDNIGMGRGMNNMNTMGMSKPDSFADIRLAPKGNLGNNNFNNQPLKIIILSLLFNYDIIILAYYKNFFNNFKFIK